MLSGRKSNLGFERSFLVTQLTIILRQVLLDNLLFTTFDAKS